MLFQFIHPGGHLLHVAHQRALGQLQLNIAGTRSGPHQRLQNLIHKIRLEKLTSADIDGHRNFAHLPRSAPHGCLPARGLHNPVAQRHNQSGILSQRDKLSRQQEPARWVVPAQECLRPDPGPGVRLGLIVERKLIALDSRPQIGLHGDALVNGGLQSRSKEPYRIASCRPCMIDSNVALLQNVLGAEIRVTENRDPDAGGTAAITTLQRVGLSQACQDSLRDVPRSSCRFFHRLAQMLQNHGKLVSTRSRHRVDVADTTGNAPGRLRSDTSPIADPSDSFTVRK